MTALALSVFTASLLGSVHCAGMCGGLAAVASGSTRDRRTVHSVRATIDRPGGRLLLELSAHGYFSLGRLVAYVVLGAVAGSVGALVDLAGHLAGIARAAAVLAGIAVIGSGVAMFLDARGVRRPRFAVPRSTTRLFAHAVRTFAAAAPSTTMRRAHALRGLALGVLAACLPCGWLYAFVLTAAATATPLGGALVMCSFWLGTLPALVLVGAGARALTGSLRRHVPVACAVALTVVGLLTVAGRTVIMEGLSKPPKPPALGAPRGARGRTRHSRGAPRPPDSLTGSALTAVPHGAAHAVPPIAESEVVDASRRSRRARVHPGPGERRGVWGAISGPPQAEREPETRPGVLRAVSERRGVWGAISGSPQAEREPEARPGSPGPCPSVGGFGGPFRGPP
ncbi:MAG: sulfite exporter TauE/SafE family protein [Candidatus Rokubacteria bacterium]|nr:sulfite exporter TauE/SafE family protein [Candidatus Rokubacteria bacterium]